MEARNRGAKLSPLFVGTVFVSLGLLPSDGFSQASFFQGKTSPSSKVGIPVVQETCESRPCSLSYRSIFREIQRL